MNIIWTAYIVSGRCDVTGLEPTVNRTLQNGHCFSTGLRLVFDRRTAAHA